MWMLKICFAFPCFPSNNNTIIKYVSGGFITPWKLISNYVPDFGPYLDPHGPCGKFSSSVWLYNFLFFCESSNFYLVSPNIYVNLKLIKIVNWLKIWSLLCVKIICFFLACYNLSYLKIYEQFLINICLQ